MLTKDYYHHYNVSKLVCSTNSEIMKNGELMQCWATKLCRSLAPTYHGNLCFATQTLPASFTLSPFHTNRWVTTWVWRFFTHIFAHTFLSIGSIPYAFYSHSVHSVFRYLYFIWLILLASTQLWVRGRFCIVSPQHLIGTLCL